MKRTFDFSLTALIFVLLFILPVNAQEEEDSTPVKVDTP